MDMIKIQNALDRMDVSRNPWNPTFVLGTCSETGKPKVSCALTAPDSRAQHRPKMPHGIPWPAHTVRFDSDEPAAVHAAAREALHLAMLHETDETTFVDGKLLVDPHVQV